MRWENEGKVALKDLERACPAAARTAVKVGWAGERVLGASHQAPPAGPVAAARQLERTRASLSSGSSPHRP